MIARLRHLVPIASLLNIYWFLIEPYISYGLITWDQAANIHLNKVVILQKRALRLIFCILRLAKLIVPRYSFTPESYQ